MRKYALQKTPRVCGEKLFAKDLWTQSTISGETLPACKRTEMQLNEGRLEFYGQERD